MAKQDFERNIIHRIRRDLIRAPIVASGRWQSRNVEDVLPPGMVDLYDTPELVDIYVRLNNIPETRAELDKFISPNQPWVEEHFQERVSGKPTNPGDTYYRWPWYEGGVENHKEQGQFSHTYQERFWPKAAGMHVPEGQSYSHSGIRYDYGDLDDVVDLLAREPLTRQAFLPVWFPEDTGVVHGERVPCSIGYQFLIRDGRLNVIYTIRSCDFVRYFRDDIYLACRLAQWVRSRIDEKLLMGWCTMNIGSLHCFRGDLPKLKREHEEAHNADYS